MRRVRVLLLGLVALLAASCRVDTTVEIDVAPDGSGTVAVTVVADADAVASIPDAPNAIRLDDLAAAGWRVTAPELDAAGAMTIAVEKDFATPEALPGVLDEIAGPGTVFDGISLTVTHRFDRVGLSPATTSYRLEGTVDPDPPPSAFADGSLTEFLANREAQLALERNTDDRVVVRVRLPDGESSTTGEVDGEAVTWETLFGADEPITLDATSSSDDILPRVWALVALAALVVLLGVLASRVGAYCLAKLRTPKGRRRRDIRSREQRAATRAQEAARPRTRMLRLLVVDVHGVVVRPTDPVEGLLLPLITAERPDSDPEQVRELHRRLTLGRISVEEFWADVGLGPVAEEIETRYLSSFRLVPGLHPFLDRMAASRLPVAAIGNQPRAWGDRLRRMAALDDAVASWLVSGDVGSALPEPALFEATRRTMSVDLFDCFYLSNVVANLDAAAELGMATGLFLAGNEQAPETTHTVIRGFEDLLRSRSS